MRRSAVLPLLLLVLLAGSLARPGDAPARLKGIDVSNHQGDVAWHKIPDRQSFAFIKASEGTTFVDAWYGRNRAAANNHGKKVGAYHFASPDGDDKVAARRDGRGEAVFFDRHADPRRGDLRPVLDIEIDGGLRPELLVVWAKSFVKKLTRRVGAPPMIYTTPAFWRSAMGNSRWFARNGIRALWIAHWEVRRPNVPANNWAGRGWTFWQVTSCGDVKGIRGCVDKNVYRHKGLRRVSIR